MKIIFSKKFKKQFAKLRKNEKTRVLKALKKFEENPFERSLNNHELHGKDFAGLRSISAGGDIRLLFEEENSYILIMCRTLRKNQEKENP